MAKSQSNPKSTSKTRRAQFFVEAFVIVCPHCDGCQVNQDGSEMWTTSDLEILRESGKHKRQCVECDEWISIDATPSSAKFDHRP